MISLAMSSILEGGRFRRRSAALFMMLLSVLIPTVKVLGTLIRMFWSESAFWSGMLMVIGVRLRYAESWMSGQTRVPPPWMHLADWPSPTFP